MKRILILIGVVLTAVPVRAQYKSAGLVFEVNQIRGCAPFDITILSTNGRCDAANGKSCFMFYEGGRTNRKQDEFNFRYTTPGKYYLRIEYQGGASTTDSIFVTVDQNIAPAFEVSTCSGDKAIIKITDSNYPEYRVGNFGDGNSTPFGSIKNFQHPYNVLSPTYPNFNISVRGIYKNNGGSYAMDNCNANSQPFTALPVLAAPQINTLTAGDLLTATDPSQARLDFTPQPNTQTRIDISVNNATSFQAVKNSSGVTSEVISNLDLNNNYYCFRLSAFDPCTSLPVASTIVGPICSHKFTVTAKDGVPSIAPNGVMQLDWLTNGGSATTDIYRNSATYQNLPGTQSAFPDTDIICNTEYRYKIVSNYNWGGRSISLEKRSKSFTTLKPATILNTSSEVSTNGVQLSWKQDPNSTTTAYNLFRSQNQGTFFSLATSPTIQYQDGTYNSNADFCYLINYRDQCNNGSLDSSPICPIRLRGSVNNKNEVSLSWNDYTGWNLGVKNYLVEKYDQNGNTLVASGTIIGKTYVELSDVQNQIVSYKIFAVPIEVGLVQSVSNQVTITKEINLFYPTAFTPDSKGPTENENFKVGGQFIAKFELSIFDRWGSLIFFTDKNEPWDGSQSGQPMPIATYVWTANIVDMAGRSLKRSGTVLLLRK